MKELEEYNLSLKSLLIGSYGYHFSLDDSFFERIEAPDIQQGKLDVDVKVEKTVHNIELNFHLKGIVNTICDRCLGELIVPIDTCERLFVKFGKEYFEETDELIIIPEDGIYNIAWIMYEFIVLAIPICRLHEDGDCDEEMMDIYSKYVVGHVDDDIEGDFEDEDIEEENKEVDPRWAALKNIFDNN